MALSGLEIYKLLPKTNCRKCGFQTCLAFAMQLAKKAATTDKCPFVTDEVKSVLDEASMPAIRLVNIGVQDNAISVGHETVMFRHEEKFHNPTALGFIIEDTLKGSELESAINEINRLDFERVGERLKVNLIALKQVSAKSEDFVSCLSKIKEKTSCGLILMTSNADTLRSALKVCAEVKPLVFWDGTGSPDVFIDICKEFKTGLILSSSNRDALRDLTKKVSSAGVKDIVLNIASEDTNETLWQLTQIRRLSIKKSERSLGYPVMIIADGSDDVQSACRAASYIAKYASIVLLKTRRPELILSLLTLRQNIFTDPQKPLQVEPKVYPVGAADKNSAVLVTTNFSLTYYTVLGEVEASRKPAHILCVDTEGMSVLTAWAAEKFTAQKLSDTFVKFKLEEIVNHKSIIIPGYVAMMSGDLEDESGWKVVVGPREAAAIPSFLKNLPSA